MEEIASYCLCIIFCDLRSVHNNAYVKNSLRKYLFWLIRAATVIFSELLLILIINICYTNVIFHT